MATDLVENAVKAEPVNAGTQTATPTSYIGGSSGFNEKTGTVTTPRYSASPNAKASAPNTTTPTTPTTPTATIGGESGTETTTTNGTVTGEVGATGTTGAEGATAATPTDPTYKTKTYAERLAEVNGLNQNNLDTLGTMYDSAKTSQLANLEAAYQQNLSNLNAAQEQIDPTYQSSANQLAAQYEIQRRNNNLQAAANGLNTGAQSQMALAQANSYQRNYADMMKAKANALTEAQRNINDLTTQYSIAVNEAIANNDFERAKALQAEYNNNYSRLNEAEQTAYQRQAAQADLAAQYGDFTGYLALGYSLDQVNAFTKLWIAQNGKNNGNLAWLSGALDDALNNGLISEDDYKNISGKNPGSGANIGGGQTQYDFYYNGRYWPAGTTFE